MTDRIKTYPVGMATVLDAFAKLFAPKPCIYVFRSLEGWQYSAAELTTTHQAVIGMSEELYHAVSNHLMCESMTRLEDRAEVRYVHEGASVRIDAAPGLAATCPPEKLPDFPAPLEIRPKPLGGA